MNNRFFASVLALAILCVDAVTKYFTHLYLPVMKYPWTSYPYGGIPVFKDFFGIEFSISHQINKGAAWGMFPDYQMALLYVRIAFIVGLLLYFLFFNRDRRLNIPFALIIAGAVGNVVDYFIYGHVVDMFHAVLWGYDFPVFNVADSAICIGVLWLFIASCFESKQEKET